MQLGTSTLGSTAIGSTAIYADGILPTPPAESGIASFDPINKRIILKGTDISVAAIFVDWQIWTADPTNSIYEPAFRTTGGDILGSGLSIPVYYFLTNNWRIRPMEQSQTLTIIGNLFVDGGNGDAIVPTLGDFNVLVKLVIPVQAQSISTPSAEVDAAEIANAVWNVSVDAMSDKTTIGGYISKVLLSIPKFLGLK